MKDGETEEREESISKEQSDKKVSEKNSEKEKIV